MRLWVASLCFYAFIFIFCEILRGFAHRFELHTQIGGEHHHLITSLVYEFIGTVQLCAPMFDVNFVMDNYGLSGVFLEIVLIELVNAFLFQRAFADPCQLFYNYMKGSHSMIYSSLLLAVQFIAAYASWLLSRQFFALNLHSQHINAFEEECSADLTVAILYGSIVEAFGLFAGKFADFCIEKRALSPTHANVINAICSGTITILGINISGMYANPIVAWALTFNCKGISHLGHISVYWLAPICAFFATKTVFGDENDQQQEEAEKSFDETGKLANPTNGNGTKKVN